MTFSDGITLGLLAPPAIGVVGWLFVKAGEFAERREEARALTSEDRIAFIYSRKADEYRRQGHENPSLAAWTEINGSVEIARFRAYACVEYVKNGRDLDDARDEWWKNAAKRLMDIHSVGRDKAEATYFVKSVHGAIIALTPETVYTDGEAAEKWRAEKKRIADWNAEYDRRRMGERDPVADATLNAMWENLIVKRV